MHKGPGSLHPCRGLLSVLDNSHPGMCEGASHGRLDLHFSYDLVMLNSFLCTTLAFLGIQTTMKILRHLQQKSQWEKGDENQNLAFRFLISSQAPFLHDPGNAVVIGLLHLF